MRLSLRRSRFPALLIGAALVLLLGWTPAQAQGQTDSPPETEAPQTDGAPKPTYHVLFLGLEEAHDLEHLVRDSSALLSQSDNPPRSRAGLQRRAATDVERFTKAARSLGYYDAVFLDEVEASPDPEVRFRVVIAASTGPVYKIARIDIEPVGDTDATGLSMPAERLGLKVGDPAEASPVINAQSRIVRALQEDGRPLATAKDRRTVVDHATATMEVTYQVDPGPEARFGQVTVKGAESVDPTFVLRRLPWTYGERADVRKLEEGRDNLIGTGLFTSASVGFGDAVDDEGLIPITVTVTERDRRSIGAGVSYSTSEGLSTSAFWTHRNVFGGAERFDIRATYGEVETGLQATLRIPDVIYNDQDLQLTTAYADESTDGYNAIRYAAEARFDRRLSKIFSVDYGLSFERSKIDDDGEEQNFTLIGVPLGAAIDTSNDLLNPTKGSRTRLDFTPYLEELGSTVGFAVTTLHHSQYYTLDDAGDFVLAGRAGFGTIAGVNTSNIPADKRLYAGGSGSVRGYALDAVGPLDSNNEPVGGRSEIEVGLELRWRVWGDVGLVPFIDGGQVYDDELPTLDEELLWAAGLGLRYHTPIGPVRVDLAFPINGRASDDTFQLYFSLGQAF